jgi:Flp pilus assembly pilin Flp
MTRGARRAHRARGTHGIRRLRRDAGQTVTEYLMILGILTAIIIAITKMVAPAIADGMIRYMERRVVYNSSVADGGAGKAKGRVSHHA